MLDAGAVQVTWVWLSCLQADGGNRPLASRLWFARMTAFISGPLVGLGSGLCDIVAEALGCPLEPPLRPAQMPSPAMSTTTAASATIQRGCRYQRGPPGPPRDGGAPASWPGPPGPATPYSRRWEVRVPPSWPPPDRPAAGGP